MKKIITLFTSLLLLNAILIGGNVRSIKASSTIYVNFNDGYVDNDDVYSGFTQMSLGDWNTNQYAHCYVRFNISGISGTLYSAVLNLYVDRSVHNNDHYSTSPLENPGLGNCQVIHIVNYGTLDISDFNTPSIGNDPGILLNSSVNPNKGYVSIDVKAAMQDDINNHREWSAFMLKMSTNTDNDNRNDYWVFLTSENSGISEDGYVYYDLISGPVIDQWVWILIAAAAIGIVGAGAVVFWQWKKRHKMPQPVSKTLPPPPPPPPPPPQGQIK